MMIRRHNNFCQPLLTLSHFGFDFFLVKIYFLKLMHNICLYCLYRNWTHESKTDHFLLRRTYLMQLHIFHNFDKKLILISFIWILLCLKFKKVFIQFIDLHSSLCLKLLKFRIMKYKGNFCWISEWSDPLYQK